jgi:hypothetical protein
VIEFLNRQLSSEVFKSTEYAKFLNLVADNKEIAGAEEYRKITGAAIEEAHLSTSVAENLQN